MSAEDYIYISYMKFPEEIVEAFVKWFTMRHAPDLYECGFLSCACYQNIDDTGDVIDLYRLDTLSVFDRERYKSLDLDVNKRRFMGRMLDHGVIIYDRDGQRSTADTEVLCRDKHLVWIRPEENADGQPDQVLDALSQNGLLSDVRVNLCGAGPKHPRAKSAKYGGGAILLGIDDADAASKIRTHLTSLNKEGLWSVTFWNRLYPSPLAWIDEIG